MAKDVFEDMLTQMDITDRQRSVLRASMKLFANQGFEQTTTKQIAQEAGVAEGTVYKQFKTKKGILTALLKPVDELVIPQMALEFNQEFLTRHYPKFADFLKEMFYDRLNLVSVNRDFALLMYGQILSNPQLRSEWVDTFKNAVIGSMISAIDFYQSAGQLKKSFPVVSIIQLIISTLVGYMVRLVIVNDQFDLSRAIQEGTDFILHGVAVD